MDALEESIRYENSPVLQNSLANEERINQKKMRINLLMLKVVLHQNLRLVQRTVLINQKQVYQRVKQKRQGTETLQMKKLSVNSK